MQYIFEDMIHGKKILLYSFQYYDDHFWPSNSILSNSYFHLSLSTALLLLNSAWHITIIFITISLIFHPIGLYSLWMLNIYWSDKVLPLVFFWFLIIPFLICTLCIIIYYLSIILYLFHTDIAVSVSLYFFQYLHSACFFWFYSKGILYPSDIFYHVTSALSATVDCFGILCIRQLP